MTEEIEWDDAGLKKIENLSDDTTCALGSFADRIRNAFVSLPSVCGADKYAEEMLGVHNWQDEGTALADNTEGIRATSEGLRDGVKESRKLLNEAEALNTESFG